MSNRTERDQGFSPQELRSGLGEFPGWKGLQRTGDTVIRSGRFFRLWNAQITDGTIECRGGQLLFADMGTDSTRPQCITSIFSTNNDWPDIGQQAEIRFADLQPATSTNELAADTYGVYRGDEGVLVDGQALTGTVSRRHLWLRDGADNTASGQETETTTNSSVRLRDRVYVADLDGGVRYLTPGSATYTVLAASGAQFAADSRPLCMVYKSKLAIVAIDTFKTYDPDTGTWSTIAMPGGTTGFIPAGWTLFANDDCLYIVGTADIDVELLKFDGTTLTVTYTPTHLPIGTPHIALDVASLNGRIVLTYFKVVGISDGPMVVESSEDGITFTGATVPTATDSPTRMCVADGMIWSLGAFSEGVISTASLLYSYDGSEWLEVGFLTSFPPLLDGGVAATADIVQIAPVDSTVADTTAEP